MLRTVAIPPNPKPSRHAKLGIGKAKPLRIDKSGRDGRREEFDTAPDAARDRGFALRTRKHSQALKQPPFRVLIAFGYALLE